MKTLRFLMTFCLFLLFGFSVFSQNLPTIPVHLEFPVHPMPFKMDGKTCLLYEMHVTSFRTTPIEIRQIDVFNDELSSTPLASFDDELDGMVTNPGIKKGKTEKRIIKPGERAVFFMQVKLEKDMPTPNILQHRIFIKPPNSKTPTRTIEHKGITINTMTPPIIQPPLIGDGWVSFNGISNNSGHRRAIIPLNGTARIAQRFAIDWLKLGADGKAFKESPEKNENFYGYGEDLIAVADGIVVDTKDDIVENDMTAGKPAVRITIDTIGGNYVILDIGNGYSAFYAHMIPGSLKVKVGDKVKAGQVLGKLGNSGNSDAPHLHFHITNGNSPLGAEGVPYLIDSFNVQGKVLDPDILMEGKSWKPSAEAFKDTRFMQIPSENLVISFRKPITP